MRKWINLFENQEIGKIYYHASLNDLPIGTILTGRFGDYEKDWGYAPFYIALEHHRPDHMIPHSEAVFMLDNNDDLDNVGGSTDYVFVLEPLEPVQRHDMNWSSEISSLLDDGYDYESNKIKNVAQKYWDGVPHHSGDSLWEYLTRSARILSVEEF